MKFKKPAQVLAEAAVWHEERRMKNLKPQIRYSPAQRSLVAKALVYIAVFCGMIFAIAVNMDLSGGRSRPPAHGP